jgi:hypothetical protein
VATCWGKSITYTDATKATSATNPVIWRNWLWMAADRADFLNGYRFWPKQEIQTVLVESDGGTIRAWGKQIVLAGAYSSLGTTAAFVSGALFTLF